MQLTKAEKLAMLKDHMQRNFKLPLRDQATQLVFGEGNPEAKIYFLGEAPGFHEDKQGRPFVGVAGKLLDEMLQTIDLNREDVYITNVIRYRPPNNRDPLPEELDAFDPYIKKEIEVIEPDIIVTLGRFSMAKFFPDEKISRIHGKAKTIMIKNRSAIAFPMFHPAAALRDEAILEQFKIDFLLLKTLVQKEGSDSETINSLEDISLLIG